MKIRILFYSLAMGLFGMLYGAEPAQSTGTVQLPDGKPLPDARVFFLEDTDLTGVVWDGNEGRIWNLGSDKKGTGEPLKTDANGSFSFPKIEEPEHVIVTHKQGYATVSYEDLVAAPTIKIKPWGSVEGTLLIGGKSSAGHKMVLIVENYDTNHCGDPVRGELTAVTDANGKFVFERVLPGEGLLRALSCMKDGQLKGSTGGLSLEIVSGQKTSVDAGGKDRAVIGKIVMPEGRKAADYWTGQYFTMFPSQLCGVDSEFIGHVEVQADGSFRIENVPAGSYDLKITLPHTPGSKDSRRWMIKQGVVIPPAKAGESAKPLDLGELKLKEVDLNVLEGGKMTGGSAKPPG